MNFIQVGKFKTGLCRQFNWKPDPSVFAIGDLMFMAKQFSKQMSWFAVSSAHSRADIWADALNSYSKPTGKYHLVCDNQCYSGLTMRRAKNHIKAEMDRGKIKQAEVKGAVIFGCGDPIPEWVTDMFRLTIRFREQLYITNKPKV